jgi:hypothetical protein
MEFWVWDLALALAALLGYRLLELLVTHRSL